MNPRCRLTILFDCCHSGSAVELPYVFRPDADGRVNMVNQVKQGMNLLSTASDLLRGGFSVEKVHDVETLIGGAKTFFHGLHHPQEAADEQGLADEKFVEDWRTEGKDVWMFSGCADDQTSADTSMQGLATGMHALFLHYENRINGTILGRCHVMGVYQHYEKQPPTDLYTGSL
jgi:hypothetical protein